MQLKALPVGPVALVTANTVWTVDAHVYRRDPRYTRDIVDVTDSLAEGQDLAHRGAWLEQDATGHWRLRVIPAGRGVGARGVLSGAIEQATIPLANAKTITWGAVAEGRCFYAASPVPGDRNLAPGELPFTAFGQFGDDRLDLRVFDQDVYWVDRIGVPHLIESMPGDYLRNVIEMLQTRAVEFHAVNSLRVALQALVDADRGVVSGELLSVELGGGIADTDPEIWLESTPLLRKLRRTLASHRN